MRRFEVRVGALTHAFFQMCCCLALTSATPLAASETAPGAWPRVYIRDAFTSSAVRWALAGASRRLEQPGCQQLFANFQDQHGRSLRAKLGELGVNGPSYLSLILFRDGSGMAPCQQTDALAFSSPGGRVVWVCGRRFERAFASSSGRAEAVIIHETLHTLGLGENPPSSHDITQHVRSRCWP